MLAFIWAEDINKNIGLKGKLPWYLPADLIYFKKITLNHPIIMGRKTFESFSGLLPKRLHVVLTHSQDFKRKYQKNPQVIVVSSLLELEIWIQKNIAKNPFVIGGAAIFNQLVNKVDVLYQTKILNKFSADTKMAEIDYSKFKLISQENGIVDEKNKYPYEFKVYKRM